MKSIDDLYRAYRLFKRKTDDSELTHADREILRHYVAAGEHGLTVYELIAKLLGRELTEQEEDRIYELDGKEYFTDN
jgi:hypothetical protein